MSYTEQERRAFEDEARPVLLSGLEHLASTEELAGICDHETYVQMLFHRCTDEERIAVVIADFVEMLNNSGLIEWLTSPYGELYQETLEAVRLVGSHSYEKVLRDLCDLLTQLNQPCSRLADASLLETTYLPHVRDLERRHGELHFDPQECLYSRFSEWRRDRHGSASVMRREVT